MKKLSYEEWKELHYNDELMKEIFHRIDNYKQLEEEIKKEYELYIKKVKDVRNSNE